MGEYCNPPHDCPCVVNIMEGAGVGSFHNRCRLCISEARLTLKLYEIEAKRLDIVNKIRTYLTIHVSVV
jgi:hypothetical protein